ncbi:MAG: MFS transporter [Candidatus Caldarchaeum sp.]|nr:MFS transporter [Candidatus Caldarchaeum sp.]MDW8359824.1 MFS transporter [Candidatus Caldarchaeum sp.]
MKRTASTVLLLTWFSWFWSHGTRVGIPAITPFLRQRLSISTSEAAAIPGLVNLGFYVFTFFAGRIAAKIGFRNGVVMATLGAGSMVAAASFLENVYLLYGAVFAMGLLMSLHLPSAIPWLGTLFKGPRQGLIIGLHESAAPAGQTLGPVILALLFSALAYPPLALWALLPVCVGTALLLSTNYNRGHYMPEGKSDEEKNKKLISLTVVSTSNLVGNLGVVAIVPLHLVDTFGLDKSFVATLVGVSRVVGVFGQPLGGHLHDRFGFMRVASAATLLNFVSSLYLMVAPYSFFYGVVMVIQAASTAMYFPVVYSHVVKNYGDAAPQVLGKMFSAAGLLGPTSAPFIAGFLAERLSYSAALAYPTALALAGVVALRSIRLRE